MLKPEVLEFARLLMSQVRDRTVVSCDNLLEPDAENAIAHRWRTKMQRASPQELAETIIPDCLDDTIFHLLHAIDQGALRLLFVASNGTVVDLTTDGESEMAGWYMGTGGWRAHFSKERFVDDFADLG